MVTSAEAAGAVSTRADISNTAFAAHGDESGGGFRRPEGVQKTTVLKSGTLSHPKSPFATKPPSAILSLGRTT